VIVVDTSVVSYIFRGDSRAVFYQAQIEGLRACVSFQTLEELWQGAYRGGWGERRKRELREHLDAYAVIWPSPGLVDICARLRARMLSGGKRLHMADSWIDSTALMLGCPLAAHDGDFAGIPELNLIQAPSP